MEIEIRDEENITSEESTEFENSVDALNSIVEKEALVLLEVIKYPNSKLSTKANEVTDFNKDYTIFIKNLLYTMKMNECISIAAPSVGSLMCLALINIGNPVVMFNPIMVSHSTRKNTIQEGTISIPGFFYSVERYDNIDIVYQDEKGTRIQSHVTGLMAAAIQHELDILDGKLYIDNLKIVKKFFESKKIKKHIKNR